MELPYFKGKLIFFNLKNTFAKPETLNRSVFKLCIKIGLHFPA